MNKTTFTLNEEQAAQRDGFVERMLQSTAGVFDIFTVCIGGKLGFYRHLADGVWSTSDDLAQRSGAQERYVREWLEQQTVSGILEVEEATAAAGDRRYRLRVGCGGALLREGLRLPDS